MAYLSPSSITSFGVPQFDGTVKGYTFDNNIPGQAVAPSLPGATIGNTDWYNGSGLSAQTPGGTPNPVAAAAGLNWPSPGAVGVPPGTSSIGGAGSIGDWVIRGGVFLLGLVFIGGGVHLFAKQ